MPKVLITVTNAIIQRLVWAKVILYSLASLCMSWMAASNGINDWNALTHLQQISLFVGCIGSWGFTMVAFLDKGIQDASRGNLPFTGGDEPSVVSASSSESASVNQSTGQVTSQQQSSVTVQPTTESKE